MVEWYRLNRIEWICRAKSFFFLSFVSLVATTTTRFSDGYSKVLIGPSPFFPRETEKFEQMERVAAFFVCLSSMSSMAFQSGSPCYCRMVGWLAGSSRKTLSIKCIRPFCCRQSPTITPQKNQAKSVVAYGWSCCYPPYFDAASGCTTYTYTGGNFGQ